MSFQTLALIFDSKFVKSCMTMFTGFALERVPNGSADVTSRAPAETPRYCREECDAENQTQLFLARCQLALATHCRG